MDYSMLVVTCPDRKVAETIADRIVRDRLAACGSVTTPVTSIYRWKGRMRRDSEVILFLKTRRRLVSACVDAVRSLHPYEVPEVIALPIASGFPAYLSWVSDETRAPPRRRRG